MGGENRWAKSLRIGVHHANGVVWEPLYRTHLHPRVQLLRDETRVRRRAQRLHRELFRLHSVRQVALLDHLDELYHLRVIVRLRERLQLPQRTLQRVALRRVGLAL